MSGPLGAVATAPPWLLTQVVSALSSPGPSHFIYSCMCIVTAGGETEGKRAMTRLAACNEAIDCLFRGRVACSVVVLPLTAAAPATTLLLDASVQFMPPLDL